MTQRDYIIKCGDQWLAWIERGCEPTEAQARIPPDRWRHIDGHRYCWVGGLRHTTRFTWNEARAVVWRKLKTCTRDGLGNLHPEPLIDRWRYKLCRLVPKGDTIRPRGR